jgi:hypothetical protein
MIILLGNLSKSVWRDGFHIYFNALILPLPKIRSTINSIKMTEVLQRNTYVATTFFLEYIKDFGA